MQVAASRRRIVFGALLLAVVAAMTFAHPAGARAGSVGHSVAGVSAPRHDDSLVNASVPARAGEWGIGFQRGSHGAELFAVVVAAAVLIVAQARRRAAAAARSGRAVPAGHRGAIRAPPAFA
jgi:hypothetical protein